MKLLVSDRMWKKPFPKKSSPSEHYITRVWPNWGKNWMNSNLCWILLTTPMGTIGNHCKIWSIIIVIVYWSSWSISPLRAFFRRLKRIIKLSGIRFHLEFCLNQIQVKIISRWKLIYLKLNWFKTTKLLQVVYICIVNWDLILSF